MKTVASFVRVTYGGYLTVHIYSMGLLCLRNSAGHDQRRCKSLIYIRLIQIKYGSCMSLLDDSVA